MATAAPIPDDVTTPRGRGLGLAAESFVLLMALTTNIVDDYWHSGEPHRIEPGHVGALVVGYALWLLLTLPLTTLVRRFPLERPHALTRLPLYFAIGSACNVLYTVVGDAAESVLSHGTLSWPSSERLLYAVVYQRIVFWMLVALEHVSHYRDRSARASVRATEIEAALVATHVDTARQEVEPNELFTRIESIRTCLGADPQKADDQVVELGDFLRTRLAVIPPLPVELDTSVASAASTPRRGPAWEAELLLFITYSFISFSRSLWQFLSQGAPLGPETLNATLRGLLFMAVCLPLGPLLRRYPIEVPHRARRSLGYLALGLAANTLHAILYTSAGLLLPSESRMPLTWNLSLSLTYGQVMFWLFLSFKQVWQSHDAYLQGARREAHLRAELAGARLRALQMQLHPHFLFNVLHSLSELIHEDRAAAGRMLERLVAFLHLTLDGGESPRVTVAEELRFLEHYLEIQRIRFRDRLSVAVVRPDDTLSLLVPTLILQPLVENAIKHGIARRLRGETIRVSCRRTGNRLELRVDDEGTEAAVDARSAAGSGIGLRNTEQRLRHLYGNDWALRQERSAGGGMSVRIEIPTGVVA